MLLLALKQSKENHEGSGGLSVPNAKGTVELLESRTGGRRERQRSRMVKCTWRVKATCMEVVGKESPEIRQVFGLS